MVPSPGNPDDLFYDARNTARPTRARFRYQDECVALRCIHNLLSEDLRAVVVEWSTDYIAVPRDGIPELVSIKHRDPGQGEWQMSQLREVVRDLHMVWREEGERCRCAFASNAAISSDAASKLVHKLGDYIDADAEEVARFRRVLAMPDPPLPRRSEITAVGVRDLAGALLLLERDPRYADECYRALVSRIAAVATEEPPTPEERIGRLTGTLRMVTERAAPRLAEQTLLIGELRDLVLRTHAERAGRMPQMLHARAPSVREPVREDERWQGGDEVRLGTDRYLVHEPVQVSEPPDRSHREQRASGRQLGSPGQGVRLVRLDVLRPGQVAYTRREQLVREERLQSAVPGLPRCLSQHTGAHQLTFVFEQPNGAPLNAAYGLAPFPGFVLDALLGALPEVVRTLGGLHRLGLAHRALHPDVLIAVDGQLRLRDVGLAAVPPAAGEGWPDYRAPEQERPVLQPPGPATDVYQLAAIFYHMAVGQPAGPDPTPPSLLRPELSPALDEPLLAGLAPTPAQRPTAKELVDAFGVVLRSGGAVVC